MKVITIIGARPQFIKAAAVSREIRKYPEITEIIVHTGQHFDHNMSEVFFDEMDIPRPDYNLAINSLSHGAMTGRMIEEIEKILINAKPDWLLVYGDTNSTLAGAIAASKLDINVAHVEAGLRSFNMDMPEEVNRILTDRISDVLFCPTDTAVKNLHNEGFDNFNCVIRKVGDVMQDAALFYANKSKAPLFSLPEEFALVTIHRAENTNNQEKLISIVEALNDINEMLPVVMPLHPRTKACLKKYNIEPKFKVREPVGYLEMVFLLQNCNIVMTDSGGLQKEAYFFEKPCITLRDETEWVELLDNGVNQLCPPLIKDKIVSSFESMSKSNCNYNLDLYGNGSASKSIINALEEYGKK